MENRKSSFIRFDEKGLEKIHELNQDIPLLKIISFDEGETGGSYRRKKLTDY